MALSTTEPDTTRKAPRPPRRLAWPSVALALIRTGPALMLVAVITAASVLSPVFFTTRNLGNVLAQTAVIAVLAIAQLLVIITRGIDLSVGSSRSHSCSSSSRAASTCRSGPRSPSPRWSAP